MLSTGPAASVGDDRAADVPARDSRQLSGATRDLVTIELITFHPAGLHIVQSPSALLTVIMVATFHMQNIVDYKQSDWTSY